MDGQDQLKVTTESMAAASTQLDTLQGDLAGLLTRVQNEVEGIRGSWGGGAAVAFHNLMEQWKSSSDKIKDALQSISENLRSNSLTFENAQQDHTAAINNVASASSLNMS